MALSLNTCDLPWQNSHKLAAEIRQKSCFLQDYILINQVIQRVTLHVFTYLDLIFLQDLVTF